ncbi:MAG: phosphoribosylanthranilate isomerase [Alphaproteobacteria bacterium]
MHVAVKICGINDPAGLQAAVKGGARALGLVFFPPSPRAVSVEKARELTAIIPGHINKVGLFVNPNDDALMAVKNLNLNMIQLHGNETPRRVADIHALTGLPIMKALPVAGIEDFAAVPDYAPLVAQFLFDAKAPAGAAIPGGNATAFDWRLLAGRSFPRPWMLAGGLTPDNVATALRISGAAMVDVSSGVEDSPGIKNPDKIAAFCAAVHGV